jgi:two-component system cell cycle sensor histidine kinase/response regulator CckA
MLDAAGPYPDSRRLMRAALEALREWTGCEGAAMRLEEGGDYPYVAEQGFPASFLNAGSSLVKHTPDGGLVLDDDGRPVLRCVCGAVIRRTLPKGHPGVTAGGSWWTGSASESAIGAAGSIEPVPWESSCPDGGYESIACLPLEAHGDVFGTVELAGKQRHLLSTQVVEELESALSLFARMLSDQLDAETLRARDAAHAALFDTLTEAFAHCRLHHTPEGAVDDWVYLTVNDAYRKLINVSDPVGRLNSQIEPGWQEGTADLLKAMERVASTGKPERMERYFSGLNRWLAVRLSATAPGHVLFVLEDISDRVRTDERLRMTQDSVDSMEDYLMWIDSGGRIVEVTESACRQLEYSREELLGMTVFDIDPSLTEKRHEWLRNRWERTRSHEAHIIEGQHRTKSGRVYPVEIAVSHVCFGGVEYDCDLCRDISERKKAEERLRRMEYSLDNMSDYPLWVDAEGRIVEVSESTCRRLEYSRKELLGMTVLDIDPTMTTERWARHWNMVRTTGSRIVEGLHRTKSGRVYPAEIAVSHVSFGGVEYDCDFCRDISERKQLEQNLYLAQLSVDQAPDMVLWIEPTGKIMYANESICTFTGYSRAELQSMHVWDLDPGVSPDRFAKNWQQAQPIAGLAEGTCLCKDGRLRSVEVSSSKVTFEGKEVGVTFIRGIDERKRAEQILRESEERYRQLFELESDAIILADDETGQILDANSAAATLYGYTRSELVRMSSSDLATEPEPSRETEESPAFGRRLRYNQRKDGTVFPAEVRHAYFELSGRPVRVAAVRDVTERIKTEEAALESRQMLQTVLDTVPLRISWRDRDLRYLGCNSAVMLDANVSDVSEILGKTHEELPNPAAPPNAREDDFEVINSGIPKLQYEETLATPRGSLRIMRSSRVPLRNRAGEIIGVLSVHEDVTERRMTLNALREREEQLRQSQKMEAIGRLAGGIAHDFNNVLTTIIGYSDLLLASRAAESETVRDDINEIRAAAERASALTKGILAFSRRQTLQPRVLSLNSVISDTERLLTRTIGADIELRVVTDEQLGLVEVDDHQFVQVLLNLAVNARDAMPEGGTLTITTANAELNEDFCRLHPDASPGRYVRVSVSDTGIGMDAETVAHVFEPFFTTKAPGQGTGLGLSTVYGVIAQSGGCTVVTSELGGGTTFDIYLPRFDHVVEEHAAAGGRTTRPTILLVDDDSRVRGVTVRMLQKKGFRVLPVADGDHAVSILENSDMVVDLLLTNLVLPGSLQGIHIAQRAADLRPGLGVIYMSAYSRDAVVSAGRLGQEADFLEKPFTSEHLLERVREVLGSRR